MAILVGGVLFLICYSASCYQFKGYRYGQFGDPVREWKALERAIKKERVIPRASSQISTRPLPVFLRVSKIYDNKAAFNPESGAGPLQDAEKEIMRATPLPITTASPLPHLIECLCHLDRMYVRVSKFLFNTKTGYKYLKLGSCVVNRASPDHYYFLYLLRSPCGFTNQSNPDLFAIKNILHFNRDGPVLWEVPFDVPVECQYHRTHHVYSPGIHPKLKGGTVFRKLRTKASVIIVPQDAAGNEVAWANAFIMGQPMYFEAKFTDTPSAGQRLFVNNCNMSASQDPRSYPKYRVIANQGCMINGLVTDQAKFLKKDSKMSLTFSLGALVFKEMMAAPETPKKIYLHCEISPGPLTATPSAKTCNYETATKKWRELYDDDVVCACCSNTCSVQPKASKLYTSSPLKVGDSPVEVGDSPVEVGDSPVEVGDSPVEVGDSPSLESNFQSGNVADHA